MRVGKPPRTSTKHQFQNDSMTSLNTATKKRGILTVLGTCTGVFVTQRIVVFSTVPGWWGSKTVQVLVQATWYKYSSEPSL